MQDNYEEFKELFDMVLDYCKKNMTKTAFDLWLADATMTSFDDSNVVINFPKKYKQDSVVSKFNHLLEEAFFEVCGFEVSLTYTNSEQKDDEASINEKRHEPVISGIPKDKQTFENFIVGPSNKLAYAAAQAISQDPGNSTGNSTAFNPLFIYGASGLGKTHLLNAVSNEIAKLYPEMNIVYIKAEDFVNKFIASLNNKTTDEFHTQYRENIDILLVDDIQSIAGKTQTEEEFFHTFNSLVDNGKQVILTSDRPPKEIKSLTERLCSRFESGLMADIQTPEFETRCAIVNNHAKSMHFFIDDIIIQFIAKNVASNIRQLEGVVNKLQALCNVGNTKPTIALAQTAIKDVNSTTKPTTDTINDIIEEVSRTTGVNVDDIMSSKQTADVSNARKMCFYIIREVTNKSYKGIGEIFKKDHSTIMYNIETFQKKIETDNTLKYQIDDIITNIKDSL